MKSFDVTLAAFTERGRRSQSVNAVAEKSRLRGTEGSSSRVCARLGTSDELARLVVVVSTAYGRGGRMRKTYTMFLDELVTAFARAFSLAVGITQDAYGRHHWARSLILRLTSEGGTNIAVTIVVIASATSEMRSVVFCCMRQTRRALDAVAAVNREIVGSKIADLCVAKVSSVILGVGSWVLRRL